MSDGLEEHGTAISVALVAVAAAVASIDHLAVVAELAGTTGWRVWLLPASVDGLVAASTLTLRRAHRLGVKAGWVPWASLILGLVASVLGNVVAVHPDIISPDDLKVAVGATPPLALALALHQALYRPTTEPAAPEPAPQRSPAPEPQPDRKVNGSKPRVNGTRPAKPSREVSDRDRQRADELLPLARQLTADHAAEHGKSPSRDELGLAIRATGAGVPTTVLAEVRRRLHEQEENG